MNDNKDISKKSDYIRAANIFLIQYFQLVAMLLVIAFVVASIFFVLKPKYEDIQIGIDISNENMGKKKDALAKYDVRLDGYIASFNRLKNKNKESIDILLPSEPSREDLFVQFEQLAIDKGLLLTSLNIVASEASSVAGSSKSSKKKSDDALPEGVGLVSIDMNLTGLDYEDFKKFLREMESNLRLMDISTLAFSNDGQTLTLSIKTYYSYIDKVM